MYAGQAVPSRPVEGVKPAAVYENFATASEFLAAHGLNPEEVHEGLILAGQPDNLDELNAGVNKVRMEDPEKARALANDFLKTATTFAELARSVRAKVAR